MVQFGLLCEGQIMEYLVRDGILLGDSLIKPSKFAVFKSKIIFYLERHFLNGFSNLRCKMLGWDFEFLNLKSLWSLCLSHLNNILALMITYHYY